MLVQMFIGGLLFGWPQILKVQLLNQDLVLNTLAKSRRYLQDVPGTVLPQYHGHHHTEKLVELWVFMHKI